MKREHKECNKKCYPSRAFAKKALKTIKKKYKGDGPKTVYYCNKCEAFHLTSLSRGNSRNLDAWKDKNLINTWQKSK